LFCSWIGLFELFKKAYWKKAAILAAPLLAFNIGLEIWTIGDCGVIFILVRQFLWDLQE